MLFQRMAKIMSKMTESVEHDLDRRMQEFDKRSREATHKFDMLSPALDQLFQGLEEMESTVSGRLTSALEVTIEKSCVRYSADGIRQRSILHIHEGVDSAASLQTLLNAMIRDVLKGHADVVSAHEDSLQVMSSSTESEMDIFMAVIAAAVSSTTSLQNQIVRVMQLQSLW